MHGGKILCDVCINDTPASTSFMQIHVKIKIGIYAAENQKKFIEKFLKVSFFATLQPFECF